MDVMEKLSSEKRLIDANALDERFDKRIEWLRLDVHDKYSLGLYRERSTVLTNGPRITFSYLFKHRTN